MLPLWAASAALAGAPGAPGDLYVSGGDSGSVLQFDGPTGAYVADFVPPGSGCYAIGLTFGPNGNLFVSCYTNEVIEFDGATGALIGTFASGGGLNDPTDLTFGPGGNLFVSSSYTDEVIEYDGSSGALIGTFASGGGLEEPYGLTFGPNGNLFVVSNHTFEVIQFNGTTGAPMGTFASGGGLYSPEGLTFGPNGNLFVASGRSNEVIEFDGATGALIGTFASQGLLNPYGIAFGPDGSLFVASNSSHDYGITQHYGNTGALVRTCAEGSFLKFLTFKPLAGPFPQPGVTGFAPPQADNCAPLAGATATGTGLVWGAQLRLTRAGEPDIPGAITGLTPDTAITASFDLSGAAPGLWDLLLTYPDDQSATLVDVLEILACPPPVLTGFDPAAADDCFPIQATITGSGFLLGVSGATSVRLSMAGEPDIEGTDVQVQSPETVTADFDLTTAAAGLWDVVAANYGVEGDPLVGALEISPCPLPEVTAFHPAWVDQGGLNAGSGGVLAGATITGAGFTAGTTVKLTMAGQPDIGGYNAEVQSSTTLVADFNLADAVLGLWDVVVTRPDSETATLVGGLELVDYRQRLRLIGAWGGSVDALFVEQNGDQRLAYIGSGVRLVIFDVTDPAAIIELGSVLLEGVLRDVEVRDGYAFIASTAPAYFSVVDVSDTSNPVLVSTGNVCSIGPGYDGLAFWGDVAYATKSNASSPASFDVSDPTNPVIRCGEINGCDDLLFVGDVGYVVHMMCSLSTHEACVRTLDMFEHGGGYPPILSIGYFTEMFSYMGAYTPIGVQGDYLYLVAHFRDPVVHSLLFVVDVDLSDPGTPAIVGTWGDASGELLLYGTAMSISDGRLYWAGSGQADSQSRTLVILDIATDPTTPTLLGEYVSDATFKDIFVLGTTAYLGDNREGFTIVDCSDPANPQRVGNYFSPATFHRGALDGDHLYVTDDSYGVSILDVSDPRAPGLLGQFETGAYVGPDAEKSRLHNWGIAVRDDLAYVAAGRGGFQVVDVSDPAAPTLAGEFSPWPEETHASKALALNPDEPLVHLGLHTVSGGLSAWVVNFDVSNLANIVDVGSVYIGSGKPNTIARRPDGIGYVARDGALVTVDLSNPLLLGITGPQSYDLAINGNTLFATNDSNHGIRGCAILDVATVDHLPVPLAYYTYDDPDWVEGTAVTVAGPRAYLGVQTRLEGLGMQVVDVSDPASPFLLQQVPTGSAEIYDLIVDGATVYAVTESWSNVGGGVQSYLVYALGDFDHDHDVDLRDFAGLQRCFTGGAPIPEDAWLECLPLDLDEDNDVDLDDFAAFVEALENPPPPTPTGACCLGDGTCIDGVTGPSCAVYPLYGQYQGDDTTCATVTCPPTGACCLPDGTCAELTLFGCVASDGSYQGDLTTCSGVACPLGACCDPDDGTCTDTSPTACDAWGGTYQGDATTCGLIDCPFGQYSNEIDPMTSVALAGAGLQLADDMTLEGTGARDLVYLDLRVYGGNNGGGPFDVTVELYTDCPGNGGTLIPNTTFSWTDIPDDGYVYTLAADPIDPPVTIPDTVWMTATFTTPESGWIIAEQAETGFTEDLYGHNDPPWACNYYFGGNPYAGLWANLRCVEGGSKRSPASDEQTQLHMIKQEDTPAELRVEGGRH